MMENGNVGTEDQIQSGEVGVIENQEKSPGCEIWWSGIEFRGGPEEDDEVPWGRVLWHLQPLS